MAIPTMEIYGVKGAFKRDGGASFQVPYAMETLADISDIPQTWEGLYLTGDIDVSVRESGKYNAVATYEGLIISGGTPGPSEPDGEWEVDSSLTEEPLENHWGLQAVMAYFGGWLDEEGKLKFPEKITDATGGVSKGLFKARGSKLKQGDPNPAFGLETYLLPGAIVRRTRVLASVPQDVMSRTGKIIKQLPIEKLRDVDWGDSDWLTMQARPSSFGNSVKLVEEWIKSKPGGWPPTVYALVDNR